MQKHLTFQAQLPKSMKFMSYAVGKSEPAGGRCEKESFKLGCFVHQKVAESQVSNVYLQHH